MRYKHPAADRAAAFEWLRELATKDGAEHMAGVALDTWHEETQLRAEMQRQLEHLVNDLTHCPNPQTMSRYVAPGKWLLFSNMVNAVKRLLGGIK